MDDAKVLHYECPRRQVAGREEAGLAVGRVGGGGDGGDADGGGGTWDATRGDGRKCFIGRNGLAAEGLDVLGFEVWRV